MSQFENPGGAIFQKYLNDELLLDPMLKNKNKRLNLPIFNVNMPKYAF